MCSSDLAARLDALPSAERSLTQDAAVAGASFTAEGVAVVAGTDVVDKIRAVSTGRQGFHDDVPKTPIVIEKAVAI